ncbi:MAG: acetyltransferase [Magnetococcales bacterium]|nr:acetyltransferase [Magnetococcales bacterium]
MKPLTKDEAVILLGGGGHARVLIDVLKKINKINNLYGILDPKALEMGTTRYGVPVLGTEQALADRFVPEQFQLVNGLGSIGSTQKRRSLFNRYRRRGYSFISIIHPSAQLSADIILGAGCQIMAGAIVQSGSGLGDNVLVNTGAIVDHECQVGSHVHLAPGAVVSGGVCIKPGAHIGCGATIVQGINIGEGAVVGAGAVVIRDVADGQRVVGVPAAVIA